MRAAFLKEPCGFYVRWGTNLAEHLSSVSCFLGVPLNYLVEETSQNSTQEVTTFLPNTKQNNPVRVLPPKKKQRIPQNYGFPLKKPTQRGDGGETPPPPRAAWAPASFSTSVRPGRAKTRRLPRGHKPSTPLKPTAFRGSAIFGGCPAGK